MYRYQDEVLRIIGIVLDSSGKLQDQSKAFYERHGMKFFNEYMSLPENENRPLNAITYFDINSYLEALPFSNEHKVNVYNSLKKLFDYTYKEGITPDIMNKVIKPDVEKKKIKLIEEGDYQLLKDFVTNKENNIRDRLILGLFLFTGLSRQYIANMSSSQFVFENGIYKLSIIKSKGNGDKQQYVILPIKIELQLVINEFMLQLDGKNEKIVHIEENYLSSYVSALAEKITTKKYTPTVFSNTFIIKALREGNRIWEVSGLVLESVGNVAKLLDDDSEEVFLRQTMILNSF